MKAGTQDVTRRVELALGAIADARVAAALRSYLVPPRPCLLEWAYGHPHPEFPEPRYPGFIVAEFPDTGTGIAYSEFGSGPSEPWVLFLLAHPGYGMDSSWYARLEDAFRESMAWNEPPPPGYEVK